jgi:hypothetical protein
VTAEPLSHRTQALGAAFKVLIGGLAVALLIVVTVIAVQVRSTVQNTRAAQLSAHASQRRILDCTSPAGKCFQRAAKRQAAIIGDPPAPINNVAIIAAACGAAHPGDIPATRACVEKGLGR